MRRSEEIGELAAALAKAQGEMPVVEKGSSNPFFGSMYADLADVKKAVDPVLAKHGLSVTQHPEIQGETEALTTLLLHASGQHLASTMPLFLNKRDSQGLGSAITYAKRQAPCAVVGVVADSDDDGNAASDGDPPARRVGPRETRIGPGGEKEATVSQWALLHRLEKELGKKAPESLTIASASALIDEWQDEKKAKRGDGGNK